MRPNPFLQSSLTRMYYLYILECADGTLYTGITVDVARRVWEHNGSGLGAKYTRGRRPVRLVHSKKFRNRSAAAIEEFRIKQLPRSKKLKFINTHQPRSVVPPPSLRSPPVRGGGWGIQGFHVAAERSPRRWMVYPDEA